MTERHFGGETPPQQPEKDKPKPSGVSRRTFIKRAAQAAIGTGFIGLAGKEFIDSQVQNRSSKP